MKQSTRAYALLLDGTFKKVREQGRDGSSPENTVRLTNRGDEACPMHEHTLVVVPLFESNGVPVAGDESLLRAIA